MKHFIAIILKLKNKRLGSFQRSFEGFVDS